MSDDLDVDDGPDLCGYEWADGWAADHRCTLIDGHDVTVHRCRCDAQVDVDRDWGDE